MSRDVLKNMIDALSDSDVETIYNVVIRFIPEEAPSADEVEAIEMARLDSEIVSHESIDWS